MLARVADKHDSTAFAMIIPTMFFAMAYSYPLAVNFIPSYRIPADKVEAYDVPGKGEEGVEEGEESSLEG